MPDLTLIQLISDQTMQNVLPVLRLRPDRVIHLFTPKTAAKSDLVVRAAAAAGVCPRVEPVLLSGMPGIPECFRAVKDLIDTAAGTGRQTVVNFTGGTKLMSIGAYAAAQVAKVPSLYVDTPGQCFMDGNTQPGMATLLDQDWSFTPLRDQLRVDVLGIANGVTRITEGKDWEQVLPLAEHLFSHRDDQEAAHAAIHGEAGCFPVGREPRTPADWLAKLDQPIPLPDAVGVLAAEVGLLRQDPASGACFLPDDTRSELETLADPKPVKGFKDRLFRAVAPLQHASAFLAGGWWEVIVADAVARSGLFRDLRWSAAVGNPDGADTEEDILALDGAELLYVSCKRGGSKARLLPHLEELRARAATIGGTFNRRFLAVYLPPDGRTGANLVQRARELGIRIIHRDNVTRAGIFAR